MTFLPLIGLVSGDTLAFECAFLDKGKIGALPFCTVKYCT
jgi:hypothetical protein